MKTADIKSGFSDLYTKKKSAHLYPTEFVIRAFLGTYPGLKIDQSAYAGANVLDLGFGDGRNMPLLHNLGFNIHGVEIDERMNRLTTVRLSEMGITADLRLGSNRNIPFDDGLFDYVLACHSCYYVEDGTTFKDNLAEIARVMRKDGVLVGSMPPPDTYLLEGADNQGDGHWKITHDPFGLRVGTVMRAFRDEQEIAAEFSKYFEDLAIGYGDDDYWGIRQKMWLVVCKRR